MYIREFDYNDRVLVDGESLLTKGTKKTHWSKTFKKTPTEVPNLITELRVMDMKGATSEGSSTVTVWLEGVVFGNKYKFLVNSDDFLYLLDLDGVGLDNRNINCDMVILHKEGVLQYKLYPKHLLDRAKEEIEKVKEEKITKEKEINKRTSENRKTLRKLEKPTLIKYETRFGVKHGYYLGFRHVSYCLDDVDTIDDLENEVRTKKCDLVLNIEDYSFREAKNIPYSGLKLEKLNLKEIRDLEVLGSVEFNLEHMQQYILGLLELYKHRKYFLGLHSVDQIVSIKGSKEESEEEWLSFCKRYLDNDINNKYEQTSNVFRRRTKVILNRLI